MWIGIVELLDLLLILREHLSDHIICIGTRHDLVGLREQETLE